MLQHGHVHKFEEDQVALPQICGHDGDKQKYIKGKRVVKLTVKAQSERLER